MRISRSTGALSGSLLVLLGIWGAIVPFVGPYFHYAFGTTATWHYTTQRLWLDILPGAAVLVGGLMLVSASSRRAGVLGSWFAVVGGAWFVVGPAFSRMWVHGATPIGGPLYGPTRQMAELVGYFYGLGALTVGIAMFAMARILYRPALVLDEAGQTEPVATVPAAAEPVAAEPVAAEPVAAEPVAAEPVTAEPVTAEGVPSRSALSGST